MAYMIDLLTRRDQRGTLTVIESVLPFAVERVYYIYQCDGSVRGGHRHKVTVQAAVCVAGRCMVKTHDGKTRAEFLLDRPDKLLVLPPEDWHELVGISADAVILVLASHPYNPDDYIHGDYVT